LDDQNLEKNDGNDGNELKIASTNSSLHENNLEKEKSKDKIKENTDIKENKENKSASKVYVREFNMVVKVKGVPFLNETRVNKTQKYSREG